MCMIISLNCSVPRQDSNHNLKLITIVVMTRMMTVCIKISAFHNIYIFINLYIPGTIYIFMYVKASQLDVQKAEKFICRLCC